MHFKERETLQSLHTIKIDHIYKRSCQYSKSNIKTSKKFELKYSNSIFHPLVSLQIHLQIHVHQFVFLIRDGDSWGATSTDDDWGDDGGSFFSEEILPSCDFVESPDTPCTNGTDKPPEIRFRDPVLSRLISQVSLFLFVLFFLCLSLSFSSLLLFIQHTHTQYKTARKNNNPRHNSPARCNRSQNCILKVI